MSEVEWEPPGRTPLDPEAAEAPYASWFEAMASTPQEPRFHAEGDVRTHTRMALAELDDLSGYQALPPEAQRRVFAGCLLHDVGKPRTTRVEEGRVRSPGHARVGESMLRARAWETGSPGFDDREAVCGLIRHHGLPLFALGDRDAERRLAAASLTTRLDHLALVAEADARGRECEDRDELVERPELFRQLAGELGCLRGPMHFASNHTRFMYFRGKGSPEVEFYDDTRCEAILMVGLPAAGKDTLIGARFSGHPVISLDRIREQLGEPPTGNQGRVLLTAREEARVHLRAGRDFVWNATNVTRRVRSGLVDLFRDYGARVRMVYCELPRGILLRRNAERDEPVPEAAIERLAGKLEVPDLTEAHAVEIHLTA